MRITHLAITVAMAATLGLTAVSADEEGPGTMTLVGWNDLGMHCMDADYSVMAILPPYNTIHAQLMDSNGNLVTVPGGDHRDLRGGRRPIRIDQHHIGRQDELLGSRPRSLRCEPGAR